VAISLLVAECDSDRPARPVMVTGGLGRSLRQAEVNYDRNYDNYDEFGLWCRNFDNTILLGCKNTRGPRCESCRPGPWWPLRRRRCRPGARMLRQAHRVRRPGPTRARGRFEAATAAELVARPAALAAASEERLDAPAFLSMASCRICATSPLTAGVTLRHHEMPLTLPERYLKT